MELIISSKLYQNVTLTLQRGKTVVDAVDFVFDKNLDTVLIESIDKFLKRNKIDVLSLKDVRISRSIDKVSSLYKIIKTWRMAIQEL